MTKEMPLVLPLIRAAVEDDIPAIRAIYAHHVAHGLGSFEEVAPDIAEMARRHADITARRLPFLVAVREGSITGYAYAGPFRPRSAYRFTVEDSVYVAPTATGQGIGRQLLGELVESCIVLGYRQMVAVIGDSSNTGSIRLHAAMGFRQAGILSRVGFKLGRWVDSVLMQRTLADEGGGQ